MSKDWEFLTENYPTHKSCLCDDNCLRESQSPWHWNFKQPVLYPELCKLFQNEGNSGRSRGLYPPPSGLNFSRFHAVCFHIFLQGLQTPFDDEPWIGRSIAGIEILCHPQANHVQIWWRISNLSNCYQIELQFVHDKIPAKSEHFLATLVTTVYHLDLTTEAEKKLIYL